jgi:hypothetical protein
MENRSPLPGETWAAWHARTHTPEALQRRDVDDMLATIAAVHGDDDAEMMAVEMADKAKRRGAI